MSAELEEPISEIFAKLNVSDREKQLVLGLLKLLNRPDIYAHYEHSLRVGLIAARIARLLELDEKPLFYAGLLHDLGKCKISSEILNKKEIWTREDFQAVKKHVVYGYQLLRKPFSFTAHIILWHHRFQARRSYPRRMPKKNYYSNESRKKIFEYGHLLAIADVYDALHRDNGRNGSRPLNACEIKERLLEAFPDKKDLIERLYVADILS